MKNLALVATRKGLFRVDKNDSGWEIQEVSFIGDPVTMVLSDSRDGHWYAALNLGHFGVKLHRSHDFGKSWEEIGVPIYPESDHANGEEAASLELIWAMEEAGPGQEGTLWMGTIPGGLFYSSDRGQNWQLNQALWSKPERTEWFGGGFDKPGLHSICIDPQDQRTLTVGVSCGGVWHSKDAGESWEVRTNGMRAEYMPPERAEDPSIQDPHRLVQCPSSSEALWVQHHNGIFGSSDYGKSWKQFDCEPASFGFAVAVHPGEPKTAWFVPGVKDECRVPVDGRFVVTRTRDAGESFEVLSDGLPQERSYDIVYRHALDVDATGDTLLMGSTTGSLWISEDQGDNWNCLSSNLPPVYCVRFA